MQPVQWNMLLKLIVVNAVVFLAIAILRFIHTGLYTLVIDHLMVSNDFDRWYSLPFALFSYSFLHFEFWHFFFNMLVLFFTGQIFTSFLGENRLLTLYLFGSFAGGLFFLLTALFFDTSDTVFLAGASSAVIAILVATTIYSPNLPVYLFFIGPFPLKYVTLFYVLLLIFGQPGWSLSQTANIGGIFAGWAYVKWFNLFVWNDIITLHNFKFFKPKPKMKIYDPQREAQNEEKINAILDKISHYGYESLTKQEKDFLFKHSKNRK